MQAVRLALGLPMPAQGVLQKAGKAIRALHFLAQDETQQASFSWHSDGEDLKGRSMPDTSDMTTVIVHLSHECSGMRVWGCRPALYRAQGDSVAFPTEAGRVATPFLTRQADHRDWSRVDRPKFAPVPSIFGTMDRRKTPSSPQTTLACTANSYCLLAVALFPGLA